MDQLHNSRFPMLCPEGRHSGTVVQSQTEIAASKLRLAAQLVENAAFDQAGEQQPSVIAKLIMISADLERLSQLISRPEVDA